MFAGRAPQLATCTSEDLSSMASGAVKDTPNKRWHGIPNAGRYLAVTSGFTVVRGNLERAAPFCSGTPETQVLICVKATT